MQQMTDESDPPHLTEPINENGMNVIDACPRLLRSPLLHKNIHLSRLPPLATSPELDTGLRQLFLSYVRRRRLPDSLMRSPLIQHVQRLKVNALIAQDHHNTLIRLQKEIGDRT
jgi:hypothetical protein